METLPKDIIKLILFEYLDPFDAINCIYSSKTLYSKLNNEIDLLKKHCYCEMNKLVFPKHIQQPRPFPRNDVICVCGELIKKKNLHKHKRKKCLFGKKINDDIMDDVCRFCGMKLLIWEQDVDILSRVTFLNGRQHMSHCAAICKNTRMCYWKEKRSVSKSYISSVSEYVPNITQIFIGSVIVGWIYLIIFP